MYFGNALKMRWIACPAINASISQEKWASSGPFLNGGGYVRSSTTGHKTYQFAWPPASAADTRAFMDFADGIYGPGPFYFVDPFAMSTNMMSTLWSAPWLMENTSTGGSSSMLVGAQGVRVSTPANPKNISPYGIRYSLAGTEPRRFFPLPVPPGYTLHLGVHGEGTGMVYTTSASAVPVTVSMIGAATNTLTNTSVSGGANGIIVYLRLANTTAAATTTVYGIIAQVKPTGEPAPTGSWISGQGNSGVEFESAPQVTGYSAPAGIDRQGVTATLREVGSWL